MQGSEMYIQRIFEIWCRRGPRTRSNVDDTYEPEWGQNIQTLIYV